MGPAVHIAGYREGDIAFRSDLHDPEGILLIEVALVHVRLLREAEDACEDAAGSAVGPEYIFLDKCDHSRLFICHVLHALARDPEQDPFIRCHHIGLRIEDLVRGALKIEQEDTAVGESQTVVFMNIVDFRAAIFRRGGDTVVQSHGGGVFIYLRQPRRRLVIDLRVQVTPGKLLHAVMDVHVCQRTLRIRRIIRLDRRTDGIQIRLVDALVPEARREVQVIRCVQAVRKEHVGVVVDVSSAGGDLQLQDILLVHVHAVAQRQHGGDVVPVLFQTHDLRILQRLRAVDRDDLIGYRIHGRAEGLYADRDLSLLAEGSDRIPHLAYVHLMVVPVQTVEVDPVLPHVDKRKCG